MYQTFILRSTHRTSNRFHLLPFSPLILSFLTNQKSISPPISISLQILSTYFVLFLVFFRLFCPISFFHFPLILLTRVYCIFYISMTSFYVFNSLIYFLLLNFWLSDDYSFSFFFFVVVLVFLPVFIIFLCFFRVQNRPFVGWW